jgi:hypothetical protein
MPARQPMTRLLGVILQRLQGTEFSDEEKVEPVIMEADIEAVADQARGNAIEHTPQNEAATRCNEPPDLICPISSGDRQIRKHRDRLRQQSRKARRRA